jgi:uncharacterized protein YacL
MNIHELKDAIADLEYCLMELKNLEFGEIAKEINQLEEKIKQLKKIKLINFIFNSFVGLILGFLVGFIFYQFGIPKHFTVVENAESKYLYLDKNQAKFIKDTQTNWVFSIKK